MTKEDLEENLNNFIADLKDDEKSKNTIKKYKHVSQKFIDFLESNKKITKSETMKFKETIINQFKPSTVRNYITVINKFISYCEYGTLERRNLKSKLEVKQIRQQQEFSIENVINENDLERMMKWAKKLNLDNVVLIMKIFIYTGIRESELKEFTIENLKNKTILKINNKGKIREIAIPQKLKNEINDYIKKNNIKEGFLFPSKRDRNKLINRNTLYKQFQRIAGAARIPLKKAHAHSFRHLFAKKYLEMGYSVENLADVLGHANTETTRIYARVSVEEKREMLERINYKRKEDKKNEI